MVVVLGVVVVVGSKDNVQSASRLGHGMDGESNGRLSPGHEARVSHEDEESKSELPMGNREEGRIEGRGGEGGGRGRRLRGRGAGWEAVMNRRR